MVKRFMLVAMVGLAGVTAAGCGGPSEKDKNPNPEITYSKDGPPKRGGGVPATTPKGAKTKDK